MPTNRTRLRRGVRPAVSATQWALLRDQPVEPVTGHALETWLFNANEDISTWRGNSAASLWAAHGDAVLREWIAAHPGTRPSTWWRIVSPGPRQRCGGIGTPCHERLAHVLRLHLGVPVDWITPALALSFEHMGNPLGVPPIDPASPPLYEAQAAYLERHNLLQPSERRRLSEADFRPEPITDIIGDKWLP